jgi:hypothetical protein
LVYTALLATLAACASPTRTLTIDVQTDLSPGPELGSLTVDLFEGAVPRGTGTTRSRSVMVTPLVEEAGSYRRGHRVAELGGLAQGTYTVRVLARRPAAPGLSPDTGALLVERRVVVLVDDDRVVRVALSASCVGVTCPGVGDADVLSQCFNGRCVDPRCDPSRLEAAGLCCTGEGCATSALCDDPGDCVAAPCAEPSCVEGACVSADRAGACGEGEYCDRSAAACLPLPDAPPRDAGTPDAGEAVDAPPLADTRCPAEVCDNGMDDDCDGLSDCRDTDCVGSACDDGVACTHTDVCTGAAVGPACAGTPIVCEGTACMDRACNGTASCTETPRAGTCPDDGNECTDDVCAAGACTHPPRSGAGPFFCTDDGNPCSFDLCEAGVCTHPRGFDGWACGAGGRCCNNRCVDVGTDPTNCGVCGIVCPGACRAGACACGANFQCIDAGYGADATCYDQGDGLGMRCQCVCNPGDSSWRGTCEECPGSARCDQRTGLNVCGFF